MSIPNMISLARLLAAPGVIYLMLHASYDWAFWLFVAAGASDAADGYIAKRMGQVSRLGAYLDPLADKALLAAVYLTLGFQGKIADFVVILVVFRDVLIVGGALLQFLFRHQAQIKPIFVSKLNTAAQILFATLVLAEAGFDLEAHRLVEPMGYIVVATTVSSGIWYLMAWGRQMTSMEDAR